MKNLMNKLAMLISVFLLLILFGYTALIVSDITEIHYKVGYEFPYVYIQQITVYLVFILCILALITSLLNSGRIRVVVFSGNCICFIVWSLFLGFEVVGIIS